jgi:2-polyprenyl-6-methoxyphenol hydroxylase-like FAD-dependent oxidoreductase
MLARHELGFTDDSDPVPAEANITPSSPAMPDASAQVVVVGAGPTGLLLAAELERRDVACLLIDALDAPRGWDRATVVHPRSMEVFEALGMVERFLDQGVKVRGARFHSDGETLGVLDLGLADSPYRFDLGISEEVTESVLTANLEKQGGAVMRSTRLVGLRHLPDGVAAVLEHDGERREAVASWLVACDGFHSVVRGLTGIEFPGTDIEAPWAVFDATLEGWEAEFDVSAAFLDDPPVILTPLPGRRWRIYLRPTSEASDLVSDAVAAIHRYAPQVELAGVENAARFRCHSRVAARFRSSRVLLAGDAAHVCSPAEGHGMNTGLQDAFNLGWKLALVCRGLSGPGLLDSYEAERRPVAMRVAESGSDVERGQATTAKDDRAARDSVIRRTYASPDSAHHEAAAAAELDRSYADSGVVTGDSSNRLAPGDRLPETPPVHPPAGQPCALHELTHRPGHTVLVIGGPQAAADQVLALVTAIEAAHSSSSVVSAVVGLTAQAEGPPLGRLDARVADQLGIDGVTVLAVRPDRYVGLRHDGGDPGAVQAYLETLSA